MSTTDSINNQSADDVLKLLDSLDSVAAPATGGSAAPASAAGATNKDDGEDILGFLDSLTNSRQATPSSSTPAPVEAESASKEKPVQPVSQPSQQQQQPQQQQQQEKQPQQQEQQQQPQEPEQERQDELHIPDPISSITSWWSNNKGSIWDSATSAVKQAEAKVRELQPEVTQRAAAIESLGGSFSKLKFDRQALQNTLSSVLDTIAPPISRHEQLQIHVFHDMVGYPAIDNIVLSVFERVMDQVEGGGELTLVVQKGKERNRRGSGTVEKRELGIFQGSLEQGQKLAAASIEEYLRSSKAEAETKKEKVETVVDDNGNVSTRAIPNTRVSNIYLAIQPVSAGVEEKSSSTTGTTPAPTIISSTSPHAFQFIVYLTDPEHQIKFSTVSQSFPVQWAEWLDSPDSMFESADGESGPDPRDWVIDWVEEGLGLSVGVVAQTYVSKRMGLNVLPPSRVATPKKQ
ncbi:hypothetical protein DV451_000333 [Geotrichum candidum]|uniref:Maintenance of telomere capping protein 1 n=1 Tax=Geotrichum candidum TaxID=1173061 RepID=A0A9P5G9T5_GEOCN|nr:hypothetical protein DV451_000333 [Geotrichum candidum]